MNVFVLYLMQNLFFDGKQNCTIWLNSHYLILFKNPHDATQVAMLGKQIFPGHTKFILEAFKDKTSTPFNPIILDLKPDTNDSERIFPRDTAYIYIPKWIKAEDQSYHQSFCIANIDYVRTFTEICTFVARVAQRVRHVTRFC